MPKMRFQPPKQTHKMAIITGTGGLGFEAAHALAQADAHVILAGRNQQKGSQAVASLQVLAPKAQIEFLQLDLASLQSIDGFAQKLKARSTPIDILINNAGIMMPPQYEHTQDGFEMQFGVNYLGHCALTFGLWPLLLNAPHARIVNVSSMAQNYAKFSLEEAAHPTRYNAGKSYCTSKLLQSVFTQELQRRSNRHHLPIATMAAHPGIASTNLFETGGAVSNFISTRIVAPLLGQSAADGALPLLYAATSPQAENGNLYGPTGLFNMKGAPGQNAYPAAAKSPENGQNLWSFTQKILDDRFEISALN